MLEPGHHHKAHAKKRVLLLVLSAVVLVSCVALLGFVFTRSSSESASSTSTRSEATVVLYGESLCPDCRHMVLDVIEPIMESGLGEAIDLRYVAYGNVRREEGDDGIKCQHGEQECLMNKYINCAQEDGVGSSDARVWFPYVRCLAEDLGVLRTSNTYEDRANECASTAGLSASQLKQCAEGAHGEALERRAGEETDGLVPKHQFVPWMVVNGAALGADYDNLDRYICVGITADARPAACSVLREALRHQG